MSDLDLTQRVEQLIPCHKKRMKKLISYNAMKNSPYFEAAKELSESSEELMSYLEAIAVFDKIESEGTAFLWKQARYEIFAHKDCT
jgi:hypothetical protein